MGIWWIGSVLASLAGLTFAAVSTYDFVAHLDRQVHGLHCSFIPGAAADATGNSGCHVAMMSPYSSVLRETLWGGLPISLPAMGVFAFLLAWAVMLKLDERLQDRGATGFFALGTLVPLGASVVMGILSLTKLDAICMMCLGIYISSLVLTICAGMLWTNAGADPKGYKVGPEPMTSGALVGAFVLGCAFVLVPALAYGIAAPGFEKFAGGCGTLSNPDDPGKVLVPLRQGTGTTQLIEVLDPLCPACGAFEKRFSKLELAETASRKALLFPLDDACNWMVDSAVHPGACAISEAVLCAGNHAGRVIEWSFENQATIIEAERKNPGSAARLVTTQFPQVDGCVGSAKARARLNRSLRWAVNRQLPVLTPQMYVNGTRLCDADTDIGLDYSLTRLAERVGSP